MHELSIAAAIERAARSARPGGGGALLRVRVVVGELASLEPELLRNAWRGLVDGGPDHGAELAIEWQPARQTCAACGCVEQPQPGSWLRLCPFCAGPLAVAGGDALDLVSLEYASATRAEGPR